MHRYFPAGQYGCTGFLWAGNAAFIRNDHRIGKFNAAAAVFHCFQGFPDVNAGHGAEGNLREDQLALGIAVASFLFFSACRRRINRVFIHFYICSYLFT